MCVRLYIHNKYTQYTHIMFTKAFMLDAIVINRCPALFNFIFFIIIISSSSILNSQKISKPAFNFHSRKYV